MSTTKPQDEIAVKFGYDRAGCIIVTFYEAHGSLCADVKAAELPVKAGGKEAIRLTGQIGALVKTLGLARKPFTANGNQYYSYTPAS